MADYKQVVEMLGENLASFLELAKKLFVDWAMEPKKLLHLFQNIRKDDLLGLMAGTHEIKAKETQAQPATGDGEYFEQVLETGYITVPDMKTVKDYVKDKWGNDIANATPSMPLETGMKKKVKVFRFKKGLSSQRCVDFIKSIPGAILPNVQGLAVAEMTVGSQLPKDKWILSFDSLDNLSVTERSDRRVPNLYLNSDGSVFRAWFEWGGDWRADGCPVLLLLCE